MHQKWYINIFKQFYFKGLHLYTYRCILLASRVATDAKGIKHMKKLNTTRERDEAFKSMKQGEVFYKCGLFAFNYCYGASYEVYGYAFVKDIEEAKQAFMKELEDDEEATINAYMAITPYMFVGAFTNMRGELKHAQKCGKTIINDFGVWKTKEAWLKEHYDIEYNEVVIRGNL